MRWLAVLVAVMLLAIVTMPAAALAQGATPATRAAGDKPAVVVWPTLTPAGDAPSEMALHRPTPTDGRIYERAQDLDATLRDAVQDLGFTLYVADPGPAAGHTRDEDLIERASRSAIAQQPAATETGATAASGGVWVVSPRVESAGGGDYVVRVVAVPPNGHELRVRVETVAGDLVPVRGLVMLRDLLTPQAAAEATLEREREEATHGNTQGVTAPLRSQGRAVLAVSGGLFGAFTAFSLEQAGGSSDPRVLYPLLAVGTGIGLGAALLAADEWDVTTGDAWYLAAGAIWGTTAGFFIADGHNVQPTDDRYAWGMGGGLIGLGLATFALTRTTMDDGDATLAHSGGALGLAYGAAAEYLVNGSTSGTPYTGMGYGAAIGLVGAGLLATQVSLSPSRMLLIDVGAGGGALLGAAAASPLVFENQTEANVRGWVSATVAGSIVGGGLAWWLTRDRHPDSKASFLRLGTPSAGVIGASATSTGWQPAYGISWSSRW
ncbi:MAG TPA: hypothetical protein VMI75_17700 [Polyangiaceae bacterium]|nr:hypothetical protein [Polyangiaceae bacterium]